MAGAIAVKVDKYDEQIKCFDEPYSPEKCRQLFDNYLEKSKRKILHEQFMYSYFLQCQTMANLPDVKKILEIGPGGGITATLMKRLNYNYQTMDAQPAVEPDILCEFTEFNPTGYEENYDLVAAFQILEHIPYSEFATSIKKMTAISKKWVFISLPYYCWGFRVEITPPPINLSWLKSLLPAKVIRFFKKPRPLGIAINRPYRNAPDRKYREPFMQEFPYAIHHWEIGRGGITKEVLFNDLNKLNLSVVKTFHAKVHPYHYFILCQKC